MNTSPKEPPSLPGVEEIFSLPTLAAALGICHAEAWERVQETLAAMAAGLPVASHLRPAHWVRKGQRRVVFFTAEQIATAKRVAEHATVADT